MRSRTLFLTLLVLIPAGGGAFLLLTPDEAEAKFTSSTKTKELVSYLKSDAAWNLKLQILEELRRRGEQGIDGELVGLAKGSDKKLAIAATTSLGKRKTSAAKTALKGLVTTGSLDGHVRNSAMTAIAVHWKDPSDLTWMERISRSDSGLRAHYLFLKSRIYKR